MLSCTSVPLWAEPTAARHDSQYRGVLPRFRPACYGVGVTFVVNLFAPFTTVKICRQAATIFRTSRRLYSLHECLSPHNYRVQTQQIAATRRWGVLKGALKL